jgi:D-cysteine desulfhydrase
MTPNAVPRLPLGNFPTPIEELSRLGAVLGGGPRLFIKRDDYTGPGFGGNKVRKLEYLLADALAKGADTVITCGGEKSNHCRITAALAARVGLRCVLVLNCPEHAGIKPASILVEEMVGAEIRRVPRREDRTPTMSAVAEQLLATGRKPYVIPLGASVPLGAMGFVRAAAEAAEQLKNYGVNLDLIVHSSSSGGTQAGLEAGRQLYFEDRVQLLGVSPDDPAGSIEAVIRGILSGLSELLGVEFRDDVKVTDSHIGPGYGIESAEGREACDLVARSEGILLDPVYTGKAMAALLAMIREGKLSERQTVLFWHTGGQMAMFYAGAGNPESKRG